MLEYLKGGKVVESCQFLVCLSFKTVQCDSFVSCFVPFKLGQNIQLKIGTEVDRPKTERVRISDVNCFYKTV